MSGVDDLLPARLEVEHVHGIARPQHDVRRHRSARATPPANPPRSASTVDVRRDFSADQNVVQIRQRLHDAPGPATDP